MTTTSLFSDVPLPSAMSATVNPRPTMYHNRTLLWYLSYDDLHALVHTTLLRRPTPGASQIEWMQYMSLARDASNVVRSNRCLTQTQAHNLMWPLTFDRFVRHPLEQQWDTEAES